MVNVALGFGARKVWNSKREVRFGNFWNVQAHVLEPSNNHFHREFNAFAS